MRWLLFLFSILLIIPAGNANAEQKPKYEIVQTSQLPLITNYYQVPPIAASDFMARSPAFKKFLLDHRAKNLKPLKYTPELAALLQQVNTEGNTKIKWTTDIQTFGRSEFWDFPCQKDGKLYDDCDGFAIWKLRRLIELGLPSTPLIFALVYDETKIYHAVLIVVTDKGDYVLDNRQANIRSVSELIALGYNFIMRTATGDKFDGLWVGVQPTYPLPQSQPTDLVSVGTPVAQWTTLCPK